MKWESGETREKAEWEVVNAIKRENGMTKKREKV